MRIQSQSVSRKLLFCSVWVLLSITLACSLAQPDVDATATVGETGADATQTAQAVMASPSPDSGDEPGTPRAKGGTPTSEDIDQEAVTVYVKVDGSGDYATLEEAMSMVPADSRIVLDAGTYVLDGPIDRAASVTLEGAGMDATEISCAASGYVMYFGGAGSFTVRDLTLLHEGSEEADVLWVDAGEVELEGVRVSGAMTLDDGVSHAGVRLSGSAVGAILSSEVVGNNLDGIRLEDEATVTVEDGTCSDNAQTGIHFRDASGGTVRGSTCSGNGLHGIGVDDAAAPSLEENVCSANAEVGIRYSGSSAGIARFNQVTENGLSGFILRDDAAPTLENNSCNDNVESGIAYFGNSAGVARDNEMTENGLHGIDIYDTSTPYLEVNFVDLNTEAGIRISGDAAPMLINNAVGRNGLSGVIVREQAWPVIEDNWIGANTESGLIFFGSSGGVVRNNEIAENGINGISVNDEAVPVIEGNILRDHVESGVAYFETAAGVLQTNTITGNQWGIYVSDTANPAIGDNTLEDNATDVDDRRPAGQRPTPPASLPSTTVPPDDGVLFSDDFTSPDSGWWTGSNDAGEVWFEGGELHILNWTESEFSMNTELDQWFGDVAITIESRLAEGSDDNWHDVVCRWESADAYYMAGYSADGYVKMLAKYGGDLIYYLDIQTSGAVNQGTDVVNTMQLICNGSTVTFKLNGQLIGEFTDDVISEGDIGLSVSSMDGEYSDVAFDNLVVVVP